MRRRSILRRYLLGLFAPYFLGAVAFFVLILELIDLFANLWRFLAQDTGVLAILKVSWLYLPTCLNYALPVALLFATAYTLGSLYARNELVAVFCSGVPLPSFVLPLVALSVLLSIGGFFFNDAVVLRTYKAKSDYTKTLLGMKVSMSNSDVAVIARDGAVVYRAEYYDDTGRMLSGLTVVERDKDGKPVARVEALSAKWQDGAWTLSRVRKFELGPDGTWAEKAYGTLRVPSYDEPPATFRSQNRDVGEMSVADLEVYVQSLRRAGLPFQAALAERHKRFAFAFAPFIVVLISSALGSRFRKNILLVSLLASLLVATGYYVTQMVTMLLAKTGLVAPAVGAWTPFVIFALAGGVLFRRART